MFKRRLFREHSFKTDHEDLYWTVYSFAKCVQTFEIFISRISPTYIRELKRSFWATVENRKCTLPVAARGSNTSRAKAPYCSSPPSLPQALICLLSPTPLVKIMITQVQHPSFNQHWPGRSDEDVFVEQLSLESAILCLHSKYFMLLYRGVPVTFERDVAIISRNFRYLSESLHFDDFTELLVVGYDRRTSIFLKWI